MSGTERRTPHEPAGSSFWSQRVLVKMRPWQIRSRRRSRDVAGWQSQYFVLRSRKGHTLYALGVSRENLHEAAISSAIQNSAASEGKAVTIAMGFTCEDSIILCADTQITAEGSHKYYEHKIFPHVTTDCSVAFAYSGYPELMKSFDDKFSEAMESKTAPITLAILQKQIEATLLEMNTVISGTQFSMLAGLVVPLDGMRLLKAENNVIHRVPSGFVGVGDKSLVRYLTNLLMQTSSGSLTSRQAELLGFYIIKSAKDWVDGCGGTTDVVILRRDGRFETASRIPSGIEGYFSILERYFSQVAEGFLDQRITPEEFERRLATSTEKLKETRGRLMW